MSSSDEDLPLISRKRPAEAPAAAAAPRPAKAPAKPAAAKPASNGAGTSPAAKKPAAAATNGSGAKQRAKSEDESGSSSGSGSDSSSSGDDSSSSEASSSSSDSDDDRPLGERRKAKVASASKATRSAAKTKEKEKPSRSSRGPRSSKKEAKGTQVMWKTLKHCGVLFPPEYVPHGVKMLYDGQPVDLTQDQEEVASMFAVMKETEYMKKETFLKNFWEGFKEVLGKNHVIKSLEKCDFTPIYEYQMAQREAKKLLTKEEKKAMKEEKDRDEAKYKVAYVDARAEPVGNFRVEPPGLFRGRGEHPKMGKIKKRIYPRDIVINIGEGEPIPQHPYPGQTWKEVRHDHTVTWLAYWKDTVNPKDFKYVFLAATSTFKADSDLAKYEKARKLKDLIGDIRKNYEADWNAKETNKRQMATALYFIDKLALRAGHEKDEDEADTVGCCTLKCENVEMVPPSSIKFDFLGKDSMRYENTVEVHPKVYANMEKFRKVDQHGKKKSGGDQVFETFDAQDLNKELKHLMDGLSVKVFRTYNASITLDRLLRENEEKHGGQERSVDKKKADYDDANKEVAILCNHQRSVPKTHDNQMSKLQEKLGQANTELAELEAELKAAVKAKENTQGIQGKIDRKKQAIAKLELQAQVKENLKTVALGTSKINYMDPRITIAWCKRNEVPIEKVFNKSLIAKFTWAMEVEPEFVF